MIVLDSAKNKTKKQINVRDNNLGVAQWQNGGEVGLVEIKGGSVL